MNCPECNNEMEMFVSVRLKMPAKFAYHITKKAIRRKDCQLISADWDKSYVFCKKCCQENIYENNQNH